MLPSVCMYCFSNCYNTSILVTHILSSISSRSPSVNIIGSTCVCLSEFCFFHNPPVCSCPHFFRMDEVLRSSSPPPPWSNNSCSSVLGDANFSPSYNFCCPFFACSLEAHYFSIRTFSAATLASYFFFFSVKVHETF